MFSEKFIKATERYAAFDAPVPAPYIRKNFTLSEKPEKATLTVTAVGFYRVFVNGHEVQVGRLAPYISNPDEMQFYDTIDISAHLTEGKNCIAFWLGNGISNAPGGAIWNFDKARFRSAPKLAFHFEALAHETKLASFEADKTCVCAPSPILFDDLRAGEHYDARSEIPHWNEPSFDDSYWTAALPTDPPRGKLLPNDTDRVEIVKELAPVRVCPGVLHNDHYVPDAAKHFPKDVFYRPEPTEHGLIFEFSENTACVPRLTVRGAASGQRIILQAAEYCENSEVSFRNLQMFLPIGFCQRDVYICSGGEVESYTPSFTYHGARYFFVGGLTPDQYENVSVTMCVLNSALEEHGCFDCSDETANALQKAARTSDLANFVFFPTDCPHREKNGWTGDAALSAEHMLQNLNVTRSLRQWMKTVCASQRQDGALSGIVPNTGWGYANGLGHGPAWDSVLVEIPYQVYLYRGDISLFEECADSVLRYLHFLSRHRNERGLFSICLGDWCPSMRSSHNHICPTEVSDSMICYGIFDKSAFLFEKCGMKAQSAFARALADETRKAVRERLIDHRTLTVKSACQTAQSLALYYGLFDGGETDAAYRRLIRLIHDSDDHFDGGMLCVRTVFRVLADHGDTSLAYRMITRPDAPSYGVWVERFGMVSLAEGFTDVYDDLKYSLNHHFMGDISGFFIRHIAGLHINPYREDASFVRVEPSFVDTLERAHAFYETIGGKIDVAWEREGERIRLTVQKADGVHGEVVLPNGYVFVSKSGTSDEWMRDRRMFELENAVYLIRKIG